MTLTIVDKLIVAGMAAAAFGLALAGWWLSKPPRPRRGGYLADRWRR